MLVYKKILILMIVILFTYILLRLYRKRLFIKEGIDGDSINKKDPSVNVRSLAAAYLNLPLCQYIIKSSYNSAIDDKKTVSTDMLKYVLSRGCRFIDFEVFYPDGKPMVSYSVDPNFQYLETTNQVLLDTLLSTAIANGFNQNSPNSQDPLFIQLRIKSQNNDIYKAVAASVQATLSSKLYKDKITPTTKLSDIMGKVVLVIDRTIKYTYTDYTVCQGTTDLKAQTCYDLSKLLHMESGSDYMPTSDNRSLTSREITPPSINKNNLNTDVTRMQVVTPDGGSNPNLNSGILIKDFGVQVIMFPFYIKNEALNTYEEIFNDNLYGIVPVATVLIYLKNDPRGLLKALKPPDAPVLGINMNSLNSLFSDNINAIIIGSVLGGVTVMLIIGVIYSVRKPKPVPGA